ncbi:MAG: DUF6444 domain-containing protein [Pirellula sp.]
MSNRGTQATSSIAFRAGQSLTELLQKQNPRNSSLPPSSEHPHGNPPRKPSKRRIRKQGGQEGHKRHLRELVPIEQCETVTISRNTLWRRVPILQDSLNCFEVAFLIYSVYAPDIKPWPCRGLARR